MWGLLKILQYSVITLAKKQRKHMEQVYKGTMKKLLTFK